MQLFVQNQAASFCIVIYTDNTVFFSEILKRFPDHKLVEIDTAKLKQWRGAQSFVHRVKIEILLDFFSSHTGQVLYMDTDTYCRSSLIPLFESISETNFIMHEFEGKLGSKKNIVFKKWLHFLKWYNRGYAEEVSNPAEIEMWNAGVIGVNETSVPLLRKVLDLTDDIYRQFPNHITEQFSFSYVLKLSGNLQAADKIIYHYWDLKEFREILPQLYNKFSITSPGEQNLLLQRFLPENILKEKINRKKVPFYKKWFEKKWNISSYKKMLEEN